LFAWTRSGAASAIVLLAVRAGLSCDLIFIRRGTFLGSSEIDSAEVRCRAGRLCFPGCAGVASDDLASQGILIRSPSTRGVAGEATGAYKDVSAVVAAAEHAGLARRVARLRPRICIKG
jgi:hypothetical protein